MAKIIPDDCKVTPYDTVDYLKTPEDISEYLSVVFEDGDPKLIARALGNVARARGMSSVAKSTSLDRSGLYRSLCVDGEPKFSTITRVMKSLGFGLSPYRLA